MPLLGFVFPDLGSQKPGMGQTLYDKSYQARKVYEQAEQATGLKVLKYCFASSRAEMEDLAEASVAITTHSLAAFEALKANQRHAHAMAGHGVGELSALGAAGMLSYQDVFCLARIRGEMITAFAEKVPGKKIWIAGVNSESLEPVLREAAELGLVKVVSYLHPEAVLVAGASAPAKLILERIKSAGSGKAEVVGEGLSGSEQARPLTGEFLGLLREYQFKNPNCRVISPTSGKTYNDPDEAKMGLAMALSMPVNWGTVVNRMTATGVGSFLSLGPGMLLAIAVRKIEPGLQASEVDDFASLTRAIKVTR